ncbi:MAG: phosphopantetheine-binding protein, partial [Candidatus Sericytochromatia bacterium]
SGEFRLDLDFHDEVFAPHEQARFADQLLGLLDAAIADPDGLVAAVPVFTPEEAARVAEARLVPEVAHAHVGPRNEVEARLVGIWESLFAASPIGVRDDFFALGGHSLLAVQLMARVRSAFDRELPLATLFRGATIERLAAALQATDPTDAEPPAGASIVPIQPAGAGAGAP